jgi:hypothetical protein
MMAFALHSISLIFLMNEIYVFNEQALQKIKSIQKNKKEQN